MSARPGQIRELTARQLHCLRLAAEGLTRREIGDQLWITEDTVAIHRSEAMYKLGARNTTHAVHLAHTKGLL